MSFWVLVAGLLCGTGAWVAARELVPAGPGLHAAIGRLASSPLDGSAPTGSPLSRVMAVTASATRLPVPAADLRLLGQPTDQWLARKLLLGLAGLVLPSALAGVAALSGRALPWAAQATGSVALGTALFLVPDLVTRATAAARRRDFRHALASYLDLVALERAAGAAPTEALEAAARVGGGWAFERIAAALDQARKAGRAPWDALAVLAADIGLPELADVAEIAAIAGNEGASILDTLGARAQSLRAEALATAKAQAGARSTTMVLPIAMLAAGFGVLLIFPEFYRLFG